MCTNLEWQRIKKKKRGKKNRERSREEKIRQKARDSLFDVKFPFFFLSFFFLLTESELRKPRDSNAGCEARSKPNL